MGGPPAGVLAPDRRRRWLFLWLPVGVVAAVTVDILILSAYPGVGLGWTYSGPPGSTPLGTALALGPPETATVAGAHLYNFSVTAVNGNLAASDLGFRIELGNGTLTPPGPYWTLVLITPGGASTAVYNWSVDGWVSGGGTPVASSDVLCLDSLATTLSFQGIVFEVDGRGSFSGSVDVSIP